MEARISRMIDDYERGRMSRRALISHLTGVAAALAVLAKARGGTHFLGIGKSRTLPEGVECWEVRWSDAHGRRRTASSGAWSGGPGADMAGPAASDSAIASVLTPMAAIDIVDAMVPPARAS